MTIDDILTTALPGTIGNNMATVVQSTYQDDILPAFLKFSPIIEILATIAIIFFLYMIMYSVMKFREIRRHEHHYYKPVKVEERKTNVRRTQWEVILNHANSENHAEWRLAILEADKMLEDLLSERGYLGEGLGEMLKSANGKFAAISSAWEAHKVRNQIAHEQNFELSKRTTREALMNYRAIFEEMGVI